MTLRLTPQVLEGAYSFLRETQPFARWRLPGADDVEFKIGRRMTHEGEYEPGETAEHRITIFETRIGHTISLIEIMAHEMTHLSLAGTVHAKVEHGAEFKRRARLVCKYHGFDPRRF